MSKSQQPRERELMKSEYENCLIIESEEFPNVFFEIRGKAIKATVLIDNRRVELAGTFIEMKQFARELCEVIDEWDAI